MWFHRYCVGGSKTCQLVSKLMQPATIFDYTIWKGTKLVTEPYFSVFILQMILRWGQTKLFTFAYLKVFTCHSFNHEAAKQEVTLYLRQSLIVSQKSCCKSLLQVWPDFLGSVKFDMYCIQKALWLFTCCIHITSALNFEFVILQQCGRHQRDWHGPKRETLRT